MTTKRIFHGQKVHNQKANFAKFFRHFFYRKFYFTKNFDFSIWRKLKLIAQKYLKIKQNAE